MDPDVSRHMMKAKAAFVVSGEGNCAGLQQDLRQAGTGPQGCVSCLVALHTNEVQQRRLSKLIAGVYSGLGRQEQSGPLLERCVKYLLIFYFAEKGGEPVLSTLHRYYYSHDPQ